MAGTGGAAPGPLLLRTKLRPPWVRPGLVARERLDASLQAGLQTPLCLVDAPAGFGKTTLLAQWAASGGCEVAWVSLDQGDNDPVRFWAYVVEALQTVRPGVGARALDALQRAGADLTGLVLPMLLQELSEADAELCLVLDDYHVVDSPICHRTLEFFVDHLPATVHLLLATRVDPPLPLARMRARGELVEIRAAELCFTPDEASALLHATTDRRLAPEEVRRLTERTEGWAAALHLAGLSLRGRPDADDFLASFHGSHRLVADYLGDEVLAGQSDAIRAFLLRTSILERLSAPLCDAILEAGNSAEMLAELERANLFLVPLDDRREWYRYQYLFAQLLRLELADRHPDLATVLHRRAASWHRAAGHPEEAIHHATAAGDLSEAGDLIAQHWISYWHRGHTATVLRWLGRLPERQLATQPSLAMVAAFVGAFDGAPAGETERLLALADAGGDAPSMVPGSSSLAAVLALVRAMQLSGDVGRCVAAARRALAGAAPSTPFAWMAVGALGQALYLSGSRDEPRLALADLLARVSAAEQPYAVVVALGVLSLIAGDGGDAAAARAVAERAATTAETLGIGQVPVCGPAFLAAGRALAANGELEPAERRLRQAVELFSIDSTRIWRAHALLALASVRQARGDHQDAERLVGQARELAGQFADPGLLPGLLERAARFGRPPWRQVQADEPLTERQLAVLRLLPGGLSQREMGRELYVSVNTVRTHVQAVYRKLDAANRAEAVTRARELGLLSRRSATTARGFTPNG